MKFWMNLKRAELNNFEFEVWKYFSYNEDFERRPILSEKYI